MLLLKFEKQKNFLKILRKMCKNYLRKNSSFLSSYKLSVFNFTKKTHFCGYITLRLHQDL